ncbi:MAG: alpha/beta fold hydrolase, partial [Chloroflexota bacterium]
MAAATLVLLLAAAGAYAFRTSAPLGVLVRNTPRLGWAERLLPAPEAVSRAVLPTLGGAAETGAVYRPAGGGAHPGVLLVNGVGVPRGWRDPAIATFATSVAQLGQTVYVPNLPGLNRDESTTRTLRALEADLRWFAHSGLEDGPVTLVGVCAGASLAILAAEQEASSRDIRSVVGLDPYARLSDLLEAATTSAGPNATGRLSAFHMAGWVRLAVAGSVATTIGDGASRRRVEEALASAPRGHPFRPFRTSATPADLSLGAKGLWRLLANRDASRFQAVYARLTTRTRAELDAMSPLTGARGLGVPVLLAAPLHDFAFPAGEAWELEQANRARVQLVRSSALDHVTPAFSLGTVADYYRLWQF